MLSEFQQSFSPIPVQSYNRRNEYSASDDEEYFLLGLDRISSRCNIALGRLGEPSAQGLLGLGRTVRQAVELIKEARI